MKKLIWIVFAFVAGQAWGQDSLNVRLVSSISAWDYSGQASVVGSYAYVPAGNTGLRVVDVSNPLAPYQVGSYDSPGYAYAVSVRGNYAYLADYGSGLRVIDISSPATPTEVGSYDTPGYAFDICVQGDFCYVADYTSGLRIVDISSPSSPTEIGFIDTPGHVLDVSVQGSYAYVTDDPYDMRVIDVSNPSSPQQASVYDPSGTSYDIAAQGSLVYLVGYSASTGIGFRVIDATNPAAPFQLSYLLDRADGIAVDGSFAYLVTNGGIGWPFRVIDICNSSTPLEVGHHWISTTSVIAAGGHVYAAGYWHFGIYENLAVHTSTPVSGNQSGVWPASCSPYLVTGDITVPSGQTLMIEPGVEVRFAGDYKFNVQGTLVAQGTEQDSILFTCDTLANPAKWAGIRFLNTGNNNSILQYCVIENGRADGAADEDKVGGGVYAIYTDITLRNCTIRNCSAQVHGGALWAAHHLIRVEDCVFENNSCQNSGGAIRLDAGSFSLVRTSFLNNHATNGLGAGLYVESASGSPQEVRNCTFTGNGSLYDGGAMYLYTANLVVDSCNFSGNKAGGSGGGLYAYTISGAFTHCTFDHDTAGAQAGAVAWLYSSGEFSDCNFLDNRAASMGAFWCSSSSPELFRCVFDGNQAAGTVGAFYCNAPGGPALETCIFSRNSASSDGGACYLDSGTPSFSNCTFSQNDGNDALFIDTDCSATFLNTIIAGPYQTINFGSSTVAQFDYCDLPPLFAGGRPTWFNDLTTVNANGDSCDSHNNLYMDPMFVDSANGDYRLQCSSPCIDAGSPASAFDPDGTISDMGAYYRYQNSAVPAAPEYLVIRRDTPSLNTKLHWAPVTEDVNSNPIAICGYQVERSLTADFASPSLLGSTADTFFVDSIFAPINSIGFYRVKAVAE